jgi:hypothetical protein
MHGCFEVSYIYGASQDAHDDYLRIPSRMLGHYAQDLSSNQVEVFGPAYLRVSNEEDKTGILEQNRTEMIS